MSFAPAAGDASHPTDAGTSATAAARRRSSPHFGVFLGRDLGTPWPAERLAQDLSRRPATATARLGQLLACAIWHGALLDPNWWPKWIEALRTDIRFADRVWLDMQPIDRPDLFWTTSYSRRWFADPLSQILILRWRGEFPGDAAIAAAPPLICLEAYLDPDGTIFEGRLDNLQDTLIRVATLRWRLRLPGVVADYAIGRSQALSVTAQQWVRIVTSRAVHVAHIENEEPQGESLQASDQPPAKARSIKDAQLSPAERSDRDYLIRVTGALRRARKSDRRTMLQQRTILKHELEKLSSATFTRSLIADHLVKWTQAMLSRKKEGTAKWYFQPGTALGYLYSLRRHLLNHPSAVDFDTMDISAWIAQCFQAIERCETGSVRNKLINAIQAFQRYITITYADLEIDPAAIDAMRLQTRVAAALISSEDYKRALKALPTSALLEIRTLRIFLILGFRTGMRFDEIYRLTVNDFVLTTDHNSRPVFEVAVRNSREGRTKTEMSRRVLPLHLLLDDGANEQGAEFQEIRLWVDHRRDQAQRTGQPRLFVDLDFPLERPQHSIVGTPLDELLARVTGDPTVTFGSLRHSFASFLLATLLLPDDDGVGISLKGLHDDTVSMSRKLRVAPSLLGSGRLGQAALHAVSQLCGHAPVSTTLRNYVHLLDWTVGNYVSRRNVQLGMSIAEASELTTMTPAALRGLMQRLERHALPAAGNCDDEGHLRPIFAPRLRRKRGRAAIDAPSSIYVDSVLGAASRKLLKAAAAAGLPALTTGENMVRRAQVVADPRNLATFRRLDWRIVHQALSPNRETVTPMEFARASNIPIELVLAWDERTVAFRSAKKGLRYRHVSARSKVNEIGAKFPFWPTRKDEERAADVFWTRGIAAATMKGQGSKFYRGLTVFRECYDGDSNEVRPTTMTDAQAFFGVLQKLGGGAKVPAGVAIRHNPGRGRKVFTNAQLLLALEGGADGRSKFPGHISFVLSRERLMEGEKEPIGRGSDYGLRFALTMLTIACPTGASSVVEKFEGGFVEPRKPESVSASFDVLEGIRRRMALSEPDPM